MRGLGPRASPSRASWAVVCVPILQAVLSVVVSRAELPAPSQRPSQSHPGVAVSVCKALSIVQPDSRHVLQLASSSSATMPTTSQRETLTTQNQTDPLAGQSVTDLLNLVRVQVQAEMPATAGQDDQHSLTTPTAVSQQATTGQPAVTMTQPATGTFLY